jgi:hypothetical protein
LGVRGRSRVSASHAANLVLLGLRKSVEGEGRAAGPARLDLAEDEGVAVAGDQVDLAATGVVVAGDDLVAEALEVPGGGVLAGAAQLVALVVRHGRRP